MESEQKNFEEDYNRPREMLIGPFSEWENAEQRHLKIKLAAKFIRNSGNTSNALLMSIKNKFDTLSIYFYNELLDCFPSIDHQRICWQEVTRDSTKK